MESKKEQLRNALAIAQRMLNEMGLPVSEDASMNDGRRSLASLITKGILDPILVEAGVEDSSKENILQRFEADLRKYLVRF